MLRSYIASRTSIAPRTIENHGAGPYVSTDMAKIYGFPAPSSARVVVGVISLGGGLFGSLSPTGVLTNGDVQAYWLSQGISAENHPTVVIVGIDGAVNTPSAYDDGSTIENTIDVETVGSCCPTSNLTIILYIGKNSEASFFNVFNYMINVPVSVNGVSIKPSILSCSWGLPELYASSTLLTNLNNLLNTASQRGINVCVAAGDNGSSDGAPGTNVDFPGSSPYVICCGGTSLVCPNRIYDANTVETVWNNNPTTSATGGGISKIFSSPSYQSSLALRYRAVPDIALNSDPLTGVQYFIGGQNMIIGGTSIAAPAFAAFLACNNIKTFFNPPLYSYPRACFHDIVNGNNGAFTSGIGYDACSGLGSINGVVMTATISQITIFATSVSISPLSLSLLTLSNVQLTATILPLNTTIQTITWSSSNTSIATVSASGIVTPIANGSATLTATTNNGKTATIPISILAPIRVVSISTSIILSTTTPVQLSASVLPTNATITGVVWSSSVPSIASVSSIGLVTAKTNGTTIITAKSQDNGIQSTQVVSVVFPKAPTTQAPKKTLLQLLGGRAK